MSTQIYTHPEIGFQERQAVGWLGAFLNQHGFAFEPGIVGLETAFRAHCRGGQERPHVALLAEFDALSGLGHACGHNLICAASVGAAVALRGAAAALPGTISVLGTPAEEGGGGKVFMVERGVFDGVDAALMFHRRGTTGGRGARWRRGA